MQRIRKIHYKVFGLTDCGKVREKNEDAFLINKEFGFFAVADGMGGHAGGEIASATSVQTSEEFVTAVFSSMEGEDTLEDVKSASPNEEKMKRLIEKANRAILEKNREARDKRGKMGTTFVCAKILGEKIYVANTGDSRCYLIRSGSMQQLTQDHSAVEEKMQSGTLDANDPVIKKMRNVITNSLGINPDVFPDVITSLPQKGDVYLLCSDGLTKMISDEKIAAMVSGEADLQQACHRLVNLANEMGGKDNITVLLLEIMGVETTMPGREPGRKSAEGGEETLM